MPARRTTKHSTKSPPRPKVPSEIAIGVFVGGWEEAVHFDGPRFCVLDEPPPDMPPATHIAIYDDSRDRPLVANLDKLADAMERARTKNGSVMVFCGHGVRRSPLAGAWYLHRIQKLSLDQAYDRIRAVRPKIEAARDWIGHAEELSS